MYQASNAATTITTENFFHTNGQQRNDDQYQGNTNEVFQQVPVEQQQHYQPAGSIDPNSKRSGDSISLALEEIGAILGGRDFTDLDEQQKSIPNQYHNTGHQYDQKYTITNNTSIDSHLIVSEQQQQSHHQQQFMSNDNRPYLPISRTIKYEPNSGVNQFHGNLIDETETITGSNNMLPNYNNNNNNTNNNQNVAMKNSSFAMNTNYDNSGSARAYVEIVEQPAKCALRFRYKCEGRSAGSLPGLNSTTDNKTYPSIRIHNYVGRAVVVISCVTKEAPYRSHPHNIVGKEGCKKGICTIVINNEEDTVRSFASLGIQCVKRKDIEESLSLRESIKVFITGSAPNKCDVPLVPVVSDPIHDKKAMSDLVITKLSHCSAPATGGREVILLCDRISKDDIQIRFYEEREGEIVWETLTELSPADIHKQVAICFKTPKYHNENITQPVMARIQLKRLSDNQVSEPRLFQFLPCESDEDIISRKRQKIELFNMNHYALNNILQPTNNQQHHQHHHQRQPQHQHRHVVPAEQSESPSQPNNITHQHHNHQQQQLQQQQLLLLHRANLTPNPHLQHHQQLQPPNAQACLMVANHDGVRAAHGGGPPAPLLARRSSPVGQQTNRHPTESFQPSSSRPATTSPHQQTPSPIQQQQQNNLMIDTPNLVVRREIIDNEGRVMRLVERPTTNNAATNQHDPTTTTRNNNDNNANRPLDSSLDRIHISELMPDINFNQNIDLNLGLGLSMNLNSGTD